MQPPVFPLFYGGNLNYYSELLKYDKVLFEVYEHFPKQTYRNRCEIIGPNGLQKLVIPVVKTGQRRPMKEVRISYEAQWQNIHWRSLEAAYRSSPYFEFYEDKLKPFYTEKTELLVEFNLCLHQVILELLKTEIKADFTTEYAAESECDLRIAFSSSNRAEFQHREYTQVFMDRNPFHSNLSILDALFNLGPHAKSLLL